MLKKRTSQIVYYDFVAVDITNNCNLRCPFCVNDFSKVKATQFMDDITFKKIIQLLPMVADGKFFLSCLYEPTLHPRFIEIINAIPSEYRKKVFFTTNLSKTLSDETIKSLSKSNIHHINISLDSFDSSVFEQIRKGGEFTRFMDNLERLVSCFSNNTQAPDIRFITVVFKVNFDEIPKMVEKCATQYSAQEHEIRYMYNYHQIPEKWRKEMIIAYDKWEELEQKLKNSPHKYLLAKPPKGYYESTLIKPLGTENNNNFTPLNLAYEPKALRIDAFGNVALHNREEEFHININIIRNPSVLFKNILKSI